jgi:DNA polymerase-1
MTAQQLAWRWVVHLPTDEVVYVDSKEKARECYEAVKAQPWPLYWDTETTGLLVRSGTQDFGRLLQISARPWDKAWAFDIRDDTWLPAITAIFNVAEAICAHNTKFDLHVTETYGRRLLDMFPESAIYDTVWLAHFFDERTSRKLKNLGTRYLGFDAAKDQRALKKVMKDNGYTWATVPMRYLVQYGGMDTIIGGRLFDHFWPTVKQHSLEAVKREQRLLPVVYNMERTGIRIDQDGMLDLTHKTEAELAEALATLEGIWQTTVVPKSDPKQKEAMNLASHVQVKAGFRKLGHAIPNTQAVTFHKLAAEAPVDSEAHQAAKALLAYKKHAKTLSTYLYPWARDMTEAGRIHPSFNTLGTITGRFSSSDPNFQNISKKGDLRKLIIAEDGNVLVVADYDQMELRQFAHYAEDERMRAAFLSGDDLYQQVSDLLGVDRDIGKMLTLASQYGAGWVTTKAQAIAFAFKLGQEDRVPDLMTLDWNALHEKFHKNYRVRHLQWMTEAQAQRRGNYGEQYILTVGGRRMRPKLMRKERGPGLPPVEIHIFKDLGNSLIQGSCADIMKEGMIALADAGYGDAMRLTVHDEIVLEVPEAKAEATLEEATSLMTRPEYVPPLTVSGDWARRYGDAK